MATDTWELTSALAALGDETRWGLLVRLGRQPSSASALARALPITRQAVMKHLATLEAVGLVTAERRGRELVYTPVGGRLSGIARDLDVAGRAWDARLAQVKRAAEGG